MEERVLYPEMAVRVGLKVVPGLEEQGSGMDPLYIKKKATNEIMENRFLNLRKIMSYNA